MPVQHKNFNPVTTSLESGINLLEASAGTGKTYAIAMLALRFIVEQDFSIDQLLIVTFTKAATKELKQRVRTRLVEAKQFFSGSSLTNLDETLCQWGENLINNGLIDENITIQRLNKALLSIDQAGIFTIHGFCQRLLKEHALESGQMFDVELSDDTQTIRQQLVEDFWRTQIYPRTAWEVSLLCHQYKTPDSLLESLGRYPDSLPIYPPSEEIAPLFIALKVCAFKAKSALDEQGSSLQESVNLGYFKKNFTKTFQSAYQSLSQWLNATTETYQTFNCACPEAASLKLLTSDYLATEIMVKNRDKLNFDSTHFDLLYTYSQKISLILRRSLAEVLKNDLELQLQQLNIMSHDSLITRTADALSEEKGGHLLIQAIRQQYRVALIDEFQDTDQNQWHIFRRLFSSPEQYLYLIGDPKQAIYKFRGADIHSYLQAKKQAEHHYTLGENWRSTPHLVHAINHIFSRRDNPFVFQGLKFNTIKPALQQTDGTLTKNNQALPPLVLWQLPQSTSVKTGYWTIAKAADEIKIAITNEILHLLSGDIQLQKGQQAHNLQPSDIAILVRTNSQATLYQEALNLAGIPTNLNSTASVFASPEAHDLYQLMRALAQPSDANRLKQALSLSWFGLNGQQLYQLLNDELQLGAWFNRLQNYHLLWQKKGFMAMMLRLLNQENIRHHISLTNHAERQIANLHHLLELIQQASLDQHLGIHKTIHWLRIKITTENSTDEQQLRLENDTEAVQIITMHRSKGLEYPVVFCPYLWNRSDRLAKEKNTITCHIDNEMQVDLGSDDFDQHRDIALQEELSEDLRILYVALTRAKYRCYVTWLDNRSAKTPNQSALAYLLYPSTDIPFSEQQSILQQFVTDIPNSFTYQILELGSQLQGTYQTSKTTKKLTVHPQTRHFYSYWQMSSYTALAYLSRSDATTELPIDKAEEPNIPSTQLDQTIPVLAKGAHTGNVIHALLESFPFSTFAAREDISKQRDAACQRYGLKIETPSILDELLYQTVSTPLSHEDPYFCLANLNEHECLKEMPFYLNLSPLATQQINTILQHSPAFQPLVDKQMQGYLTGFIDLICLYKQKYYVLDYKSNALNDYHQETLTEAMRTHNYGLQYWIYSIVLHQYLKNRLPNYQYSEHFGGIRYLFVRGMQETQIMSGIYSDTPDEQRLNQLTQLFSASEPID